MSLKIPTPRRERQEDHEFKTSLSYTVRPCVAQKKKKKNSLKILKQKKKAKILG
jgi:hypothetical protein